MVIKIHIYESNPVYSGVYTPTLQQIIPIVKNDYIDTLYDIIPIVKNDCKYYSFHTKKENNTYSQK